MEKRDFGCDTCNWLKISNKKSVMKDKLKLVVDLPNGAGEQILGMDV